jgi:hypothetical protein
MTPEQRLNDDERSVLKSISPVSLQESLRSRGWELKEDLSEQWFVLYERGGVMVDVPLNPDFADYARRVGEVVAVVAHVENVTVRALVDALTQPVGDAHRNDSEIPRTMIIDGERDAANAPSRVGVRSAHFKGYELTSAMVGIGMLFAAPPNGNSNIEDTLLAASEEGMERDDLRVLGVLVDWFDLHGSRVIVHRLTKLVQSSHSDRVQALWSALAQRRPQPRRSARILVRAPSTVVDLLRVGSELQLRRRGEDPRFAGTALRVPSGVLRNRPEDVLAPAELAKVHGAYRWRVIMGPSYRADMWAALQQDPTVSTADLARRTYGPLETAWQVKRDFAVLPVPVGAGVVSLGVDESSLAVARRRSSLPEGGETH